jgi:hypothetical protein
MMQSGIQLQLAGRPACPKSSRFSSCPRQENPLHAEKTIHSQIGSLFAVPCVASLAEFEHKGF